MAKLSQIISINSATTHDTKIHWGNSTWRSAPTTDASRLVPWKWKHREEESFEARSDFLGDLAEMERMISKDIEPFERRKGKWSLFWRK